MIKVKIVSKMTNRIIEGDFKPKELLERSPEEIIEQLDDNECTCNTEGGFSYCGCGDEFEDCLLFLDGELYEW